MVYHEVRQKWGELSFQPDSGEEEEISIMEKIGSELEGQNYSLSHSPKPMITNYYLKRVSHRIGGVDNMCGNNSNVRDSQQYMDDHLFLS